MTAAPLDVLGTGEDARVRDVDVSPGPAKPLAEPGTGLLEDDEEETVLVANMVEKRQYVLVSTSLRRT